MRLFYTITFIFLLTAELAFAGKADVIAADVTKSGPNTYNFSVTVSHNDGGWKHYADSWDVIAPDGSVLGTRTLYHPHVNEQPFTRSLAGVKIPKNINSVTVRAHCSVHDYGGKEISVELPH